MAKQTSKDGIAFSTFGDAVCPKPDQKGIWGGMGNPLSDSEPETKGEISGVQFANIEGGGTGKVDFTSVSGKKPGGPSR